MQQFNTRFSSATAVLLGALLSAGGAYADDAAAPAASAATAPAPAPTPTKHQLMKACMRKEKAAISGRENYDLAADCRDITKTEKQNADAGKDVEKKADSKDDAKGG